MTTRTRYLAVCATAAISLAMSACGSDEGVGESNSVPADDSLPPVTSGTDADADTDGDTDTDVDAGTDADLAVIGTGNLGDEVVDPKPYAIDDIAILESFPEQLAVTFTAGDPNCTAVDATARASADSDVQVSIEVGITADALTRSCVAGNDFEQTVIIALDEGLDGRDVVPVQP